MAFELNFTTSVFGTDDAHFNLIEMSGTKSVRRAIFSDGKEIERTISHDVKRRERHVVKDVLTIPATATTKARQVSVHQVIDQDLAPDSADDLAAKLVAAQNMWCTANSSRIQAGEI